MEPDARRDPPLRVRYCAATLRWKAETMFVSAPSSNRQAMDRSAGNTDEDCPTPGGARWLATDAGDLHHVTRPEDVARVDPSSLILGSTHAARLLDLTRR